MTTINDIKILKDIGNRQKMAKLWFQGQFCVFPNPLDAIEEVRVFVESCDAPCEMRIEIVNMTMEEFDKLPEFDGWE